MKASLAISIKYDLGGRIVKYNELPTYVKDKSLTKKMESLSIYNFSHLKRAEPTLEFNKIEKVNTGKINWTMTYSLDELGIFTILLKSNDIHCSESDFSRKLLEAYNEFLTEKNKDYL